MSIDNDFNQQLAGFLQEVYDDTTACDAQLYAQIEQEAPEKLNRLFRAATVAHNDRVRAKAFNTKPTLVSDDKDVWFYALLSDENLAAHRSSMLDLILRRPVEFSDGMKQCKPAYSCEVDCTQVYTKTTGEVSCEHDCSDEIVEKVDIGETCDGPPECKYCDDDDLYPELDNDDEVALIGIIGLVAGTVLGCWATTVAFLLFK